MTKKLSIAGLVVAAAASSAITFSAAPAKAASTGTSDSQTTCNKFDPSSSTTIEYLGYGDAGLAASTGISSIKFGADESPAWTFSPSPISISNIQYSFDNGTNWLTSDINTSVNLASGGLSSNIVAVSPGLPGTTSSTVGANKFRLKFTVPSIASGSAGQFYAQIRGYGNGTQIQTRYVDVEAYGGGGGGAGVPGPLPLFGAGAAFGFSRSMRRRIAQSV
jgi:hypothetical protein